MQTPTLSPVPHYAAAVRRYRNMLSPDPVPRAHYTAPCVAIVTCCHPCKTSHVPLAKRPSLGRIRELMSRMYCNLMSHASVGGVRWDFASHGVTSNPGRNVSRTSSGDWIPHTNTVAKNKNMGLINVFRMDALAAL